MQTRTLEIVILGSAAGGGLPQWNCGCPVCSAARSGRATPRMQSSIAVRGTGGPWYLVNASPDVRQQLELVREGGDALRSSPVAGVLLTDAEIDHTAGLIVLREGPEPLVVYGSARVREALSAGFGVLPVLAAYCGVDWRPLEPGESVELGGGLSAEAFAVPGDPPRYVGGGEPFGVGLTFRTPSACATYVPALGELSEDLRRRFEAADCVFVDGTFWSDDELPRLGISLTTARAMGHAPLSGPGGTLQALAALRRPRTVLVHINNTNPILGDDAPERHEVEAAGIAIAYDGMRIAL
jgi:pyrroloquinoline quinone biosynthesis protein B